MSNCCRTCGTVTDLERCGCCEGTVKSVPRSLVQRPGLSALDYRIGTHSMFLESMIARIANRTVGDDLRPLERLTTRDSEDFSIALLDGWAVVADLVTFYQERFANEGFLRTAVERRSILELARLTGYELGAGVSASVFLAFTLQDDHEVEIPVGMRVQSTPDSGELPQPFETSDPLLARSEWNLLPPRMSRPQIITRANADQLDRIYFEGTKTALNENDALLITFGPANPILRTVTAVAEDEEADRTLVHLAVLAAPAAATVIAALREVITAHRDLAEFDVSPGVTTGRVLSMLDKLEAALEVATAAEAAELAIAITGELTTEVAALPTNSRRLQGWLGSMIEGLTDAASARLAAVGSAAVAAAVTTPTVAVGLTALDTFLGLELADPLTQPPTLQPANPLRLARAISDTYAIAADMLPRLLTTLQPAYRRVLYDALDGATLTTADVEVFAFRAELPLYGHNAPERPLRFDPDDGTVIVTGDPFPNERNDRVDLAQPVEGILPGSWVSVYTPGNNDNRPDRRLFAVAGDPVESVSRADYGISSNVTRVHLRDPQNPGQPVDWFEDTASSEFGNVSYIEIRETRVLAQAEKLTLAEEPILDATGTHELEPIAGSSIELDRVCRGLEPGRWLIVSGERADIADVAGVDATELVMVSGVEHTADPTRPGDKLHTRLALAGTGSSGAAGLSYQYLRETVKVYGNVVKATHGETAAQTLGSGNGAEALQTFELARKPLTHVSAATAEGAQAELEVRVNGILWDKSKSLIELEPTDRNYITRTDDENVTSVTFGDGHHGSRLPSGAENVAAKYRVGIGLGGNVASKKIDMLIEKPLGVKEVINPIEASGGADRETRDQARSNAPLAVMALDRLVSVQDYADFARTFTGIAKADAQLLSIGRREVLHLTVALAADGTFDRNSDLYRNLRQALSDFGDPRLPIQIDPRELRLLVMSARVHIDSAYLWKLVEPQIRSKLHDVLGFGRQEVGRGLASSAALSAIHQVRGVEHVDLEVFDWVDESRILTPEVDPETGQTRDLASSLSLTSAVLAGRAHPAASGHQIVPGQLAYLSETVRDTLILQELM